MCRRRGCGAPLVVGVGAVAEDLEDGQVGGILRVGGGQGLDLGRLKQLGEEVGAGVGGGADDEVSDLAGRVGRPGEGDKWLRAIRLEDCHIRVKDAASCSKL